MFRFGVAAALVFLIGSACAETPDTRAYGRREINAQLRELRIQSLQFKEAPLEAVFKSLVEQAEKANYAHRSLNMIARDLEAVKVTIYPPLENLSLRDALAAVIEGASESIAYKVVNYGIVFSRGGMPMTAEAFSTRVFTLRNEILNALTAEGLRDFLAAHGINCASPFQLFLNERLGKLWIRAKPADLEEIEEILKELITAARRIRLELRFAEVPAAPSPIHRPDLSHDAGLPLPPFKAPRSTSNGIFTYQQNDDGAFITRRIPTTNYATVSGTLNEEEFASVLATLQQKAGVDLLSLPPRIVRDAERVVFRSGAPYPGTGLSAIVHLVITEEGKSLKVAITAAVNELVGYDMEWLKAPESPTSIHRLRQLNDNFELPLGHTAVLGIGPVTHRGTSKRSLPVLGDLPYVGHLFQADVTTKVEKNLWFFLTPKLDD